MRTFAMVAITLLVGCGTPSMEVLDGGQETDSSVIFDDGAIDSGEARDAETPTEDSGGSGDSGSDAGADRDSGGLRDAGTTDGGDAGGDAGTGSDGGLGMDSGVDAGDAGPTPGVPRGLTTSGHRTCVLDDMGEAFCWGWTSGPPVHVGGTYTEISGNCGLLASGRVECWAETMACIPAGPVLKTDGTPLTGVTVLARTSARAFRTCAVSGGQLWCWGQEDTTCSPRASQVSGLPAVDSVAVSEDDTCALAGRDAWCWGPHFGATGFPTPTRLRTDTDEVSVGGEHQLYRVGTTVYGVGQNADGQIHPTQPATFLTSFVTARFVASQGLAAGQRHSCSHRTDGLVECGGHIEAVGFAAGRIQTPVGTVTDLVAGEDYSCMIDDGVVTCWGSNARHQLGSPGPSRYTATPIMW